MSKRCSKCGKFFEKSSFCSKKEWKSRRFCSKTCANQARKGTPAWNRGKKGLQVAWNKGKKLHYIVWNKGNGTYAKKLGFGKWMLGKDLREKSGNWKGDKVGYGALHDWVRRRKGKPTTCVLCGFTSDKPRMLHWANKSRKYKRDLNDWVRLCAKCHKEFDRGNKQFRF